MFLCIYLQLSIEKPFFEVLANQVSFLQFHLPMQKIGHHNIKIVIIAISRTNKREFFAITLRFYLIYSFL